MLFRTWDVAQSVEGLPSSHSGFGSQQLSNPGIPSCNLSAQRQSGSKVRTTRLHRELDPDGQPAEAGKKRWEGREERVRSKEERKEREGFLCACVGFVFLTVVFYFHCTII